MSNFKFYPQRLAGLTLIETRVFGDERGCFMESWSQNAFEEGGIKCNFVQDNQSRSQKGILRGLHFQKAPFAQAKLIRVLIGEILDVAVDIRPDSASYLQWMSFKLNEEEASMLFIPEGFAHGFLVRSEEAVVAYKASAPYAPEYDRGIVWNDPDLHIDWGVTEPVLSDKDKQQPLIKNGALNG